MTRTLVVSDIHNATEQAEAIISEHGAGCDRIILLGDYFDQFDDGPADVERVARWLVKSVHDPRRIHLLGNHDLPYLAGEMTAETYRCPGWSVDKHEAVSPVLQDLDRRKIYAATECDGWLLSHAGFHQALLKGRTMTQLLHGCEIALDQALSGKFDELFAPSAARGFGGYLGGVTWLDWSCEFLPVAGWHQIVGHTPSLRVRAAFKTADSDIVRHFLGRGFQGKGMVVSIDKATALRMHDKVRRQWDLERARVQKEIAKLDAKKHRTDEELAQLKELRDRLDVIQRTDMALIVSPGQNEVEQMKKLGLDIVPHRSRIVESKPGLDEKFKDTQDPLSLVFVCAMWLTGFDAPSCSTVYLDKPMRNHTLMQTIARANRVFQGKHSGLIVDYANVFASLEKALAIYGAGKDGKTPVRDKKQLVDDLRKATAAAVSFCQSRGVSVAGIHGATSGMARLDLLSQAVEAVISPDPLRKEFLAHERIVKTLYDAVKPDTAAIAFTANVSCLCSIGDAIRAKLNPGAPDISGVMSSINALLDDSIEGVHAAEPGGNLLDLSKIDFEALAKKFKKSKTKNIDLETLKAAIKAMLDRLIRLNSTRVDFQEQFEALIEAYNNGSKNIEDLFDELVRFSWKLTDEEARHVREHLTQEELTIFDILTRLGPELTTAERNEVKKVAAHLLARLKNIQSVDWRRTVQARAKVKETIEEELDALPNSYTRPIFAEKCSRVFEHVYERSSAHADHRQQDVG